MDAFSELMRQEHANGDSVTVPVDWVEHIHRGGEHHYWIGSIAAHRAARSQALSNADWSFLLGELPDRRGGLTALLWRMRFAVFGSPPQVTAWHPRWPDYRLPLEYLQKLTPINGRVLVVADRPAVFHGVMPFSGGKAVSWSYTV